MIEYFVYAHRELQYALPVENVLEIIELPHLLPLSREVHGFIGNILHRDSLLPVIDSSVLGTDREPLPAEAGNAIVVQVQGVSFALTIERYITVVGLDTSGGGGGEPNANVSDNPFVEAVRGYRDSMLIVFSPVAIADTVRRLGGEQQIIADRGEDDSRVRQSRDDIRGDFLCASIEEVVLGIPLHNVIEIIEDYSVTPIFKVDPSLRGLINLRGQVLLCYDLSVELGYPLRILEELSQFVVVQGDGMEMALCVDNVSGIRSLPLQEVQRTDDVLNGGLTQYLDGVLESDSGSILLVATANLFEAPALQACRNQTL